MELLQNIYQQFLTWINLPVLEPFLPYLLGIAGLFIAIYSVKIFLNIAKKVLWVGCLGIVIVGILITLGFLVR